MDSLKRTLIHPVKWMSWVSLGIWACFASCFANPVDVQVLLKSARKSIRICEQKMVPTLTKLLDRGDPEGAFLYRLFWLGRVGGSAGPQHLPAHAVAWPWEGEFWPDEYDGEYPGEYDPECEGKSTEVNSTVLEPFLEKWAHFYEAFGPEGKLVWARARLRLWEMNGIFPSEGDRLKIRETLGSEPSLRSAYFGLLGDSLFMSGHWERSWDEGWSQVRAETPETLYRKAMALLRSRKPEHVEPGLTFAIRALRFSSGDLEPFFRTQLQSQVCEILEEIDPKGAVQFFRRTFEKEQLSSRVLETTAPCLALFGPRANPWKGGVVWAELLKLETRHGVALQLESHLALAALISGDKKKIDASKRSLRRRLQTNRETRTGSFDSRWKRLSRESLKLKGEVANKPLTNLKRDTAVASEDLLFDLGRVKLPVIPWISTNDLEVKRTLETYVQKKLQ